MNEVQKADLHIHSVASDGRLTPAEIVRESARKGLKLIALTDHDTTAGFKEAKSEASKEGIQVIPGVEITSDYGDQECHLLAYCFDPSHPVMTGLLKEQRNIRIRRARKIIGNLNKMGFDITFDEVWAFARHDNIARPHIASVMLDKGYAGNFREVFIKYLGNDAPAYHKCQYKTVEEITGLVREAGGCTILAHPAANYTNKDLDHMIEAGIDGFEYIHPSHTYFLQKKYETLADEHDLIKTGGSDFHGFRMEDDYNLGTVAVNITIAYHMLEFCKDRRVSMASGISKDF